MRIWSKIELWHRKCWQLCREKIESDQYDIVIMDEITYAINYGWLHVDEVLTTLRREIPKMHIIITGRDAPAGLIDYADMVTEMPEMKHPYQDRESWPKKGLNFSALVYLFFLFTVNKE